MENLKIIKTWGNNTGGESALFCIGDKYYYADKSYVPFCGMETMIFKADKDGEVLDWIDLYCDRSGKTLKSCINEFAKDYYEE